jgi:hypothetical protein
MTSCTISRSTLRLAGESMTLPEKPSTRKDVVLSALVPMRIVSSRLRESGNAGLVRRMIEPLLRNAIESSLGRMAGEAEP